MVSKVTFESQIKILFEAFMQRMAKYKWDDEMPIWLRGANPGLYREWQIQECLVDAKWCSIDLEGFRKALQHYEILCLRILKLSKI